MDRSNALAGWMVRHRFGVGLAAGLLLGWTLAHSPSGESVSDGAAPPSPSIAAATPPIATDLPERTDTAPVPSPTALSEGANATVTHVVDGDTIDVLYEGSTVRIRLIGIDTPETVHPSEPVGCFGNAASNFTARHLADKDVRLEFDVEKTDRYGRTLAYVWIGNELFNETLVRQGFASVSTYPPNVEYVERFAAAQEMAREAGAGLWGACEGLQSSPPAQPGGGCDPSYQGACIPPYPPDLDCADVGATNFKVVGDDPHGFDGDGDGVGCEA